MIGDIVKVIVDRPLGSYHPKHKDIYYVVNYGYIPGVMAPDGEEQCTSSAFTSRSANLRERSSPSSIA